MGDGLCVNTRNVPCLLSKANMLRGDDAPQMSRTADVTNLRERLRVQAGAGTRYSDREHDVAGDSRALYASVEHSDILNGSGNRDESMQVERYEQEKSAREVKRRRRRKGSKLGRANENALPELLAPPRQDGVSGSAPYGEDACRMAAELGTGDALDPWAAEVMNRAGDMNVAMSEEVAILGPYYNGTRNPPQTALYSAQAACARPNGLMGTMSREAVVMGLGPNARFLPGSETPQPCLVGANVDPAAAINILPLDGSAMIGSDDAPMQVYNGSAVSPPSCAGGPAWQGQGQGPPFVPTIGGVRAAETQIQAETQGRRETAQTDAAAIAAQAYSAGMAAGIKASQEVGYLLPGHPRGAHVPNQPDAGTCRSGGREARAKAGVISGSALVARGAAGSDADRALSSVKQQTAEFNETVRGMEYRLRQAYGFAPPAPSVAFLPSQFPLITDAPGATVLRSYSPGVREPMAVSAMAPTVDLRMPNAPTLAFNPSPTNDVLSGVPLLPLQSAQCQGTGNGQYTTPFGQDNTLFVGPPNGDAINAPLPQRVQSQNVPAGGFVDQQIHLRVGPQCDEKWTRDLGIGFTGDDVVALALFLNRDKDTKVEGNVSNYYGTHMQDAVKRFQQKHFPGRGYDGQVFGTTTRAKANAMWCEQQVSSQDRSATVSGAIVDANAPDAACTNATGANALACFGDAWKGFAHGVKNFNRTPIKDTGGNVISNPTFWQKFGALWGANDRWTYIVTLIIAFIVLILLIAVISSGVKLAGVSERAKCAQEMYRRIPRVRVPAGSPSST